MLGWDWMKKMLANLKKGTHWKAVYICLCLCVSVFHFKPQGSQRCYGQSRCCWLRWCQVQDCEHSLLTRPSERTKQKEISKPHSHIDIHLFAFPRSFRYHYIAGLIERIWRFWKILEALLMSSWKPQDSSMEKPIIFAWRAEISICRNVFLLDREKRGWLKKIYLNSDGKWRSLTVKSLFVLYCTTPNIIAYHCFFW